MYINETGPYKLDRSTDGIGWNEYWTYADLKEAKKDAEELFEKGYDITIWDAFDEKVYELSSSENRLENAK